MKKVLVLGAATYIACTTTTAAETALMGRGSQTCGIFASQYGQSPRITEHDFFVWAQGYMSGLNAASLDATGKSKNLASKSLDEQMTIIRAFCSRRPLDPYFLAVDHLYRSLAPNNPTSR